MSNHLDSGKLWTEYDNQTDIEKDGRKGGVGGRLRGSSVDEDAMISVSKQMEMEAGNAIRYRTCSWQKVDPHPSC